MHKRKAIKVQSVSEPSSLAHSNKLSISKYLHVHVSSHGSNTNNAAHDTVGDIAQW